MLVPNRHYNAPEYRYGFQGQEKDNELKGEGNSLNYTFRMHDPRVGRFFAVDPLATEYPHYSPYSFSGNKVIAFTELEGQEEMDSKFRLYMLAKGGVYADIAREEQIRDRELGKKAISGIIGLSESAVDGVTYGSTSFVQAIVGGFTYGYGDVLFGDGYKTRVDIPSYKFSWDSGFEIDSKFATRGNLSFNDGMRVIDGISTVITVGELTIATKAITSGVRRELAWSFYKKAGIEESKIAAHLKGINFSKGVSTKTLKKGTILEQWTYLDDAGNPKLGNYYTLPGTDPKTLGIPLKDRVKTTVKLLDDTKFLKSTTSNIDDWNNPGNTLQGGGTQLFETNVNVQVIK